MSGSKTVIDSHWDVDKYKSNYDHEHWDLCRVFMQTHKTRYPEQKLAHLTEAFYQMGVYGSSYDPKTTRMVSALTVEVLDEVLKSHTGLLYNPFDKSAAAVRGLLTDAKSQPSKDDKEPSQPSSIWDVQVDQNIIANVLVGEQLKGLFKGFVIIYDIRRTSTMNDNKVSLLEESFKRSKFGPCHWDKVETHNNICPIKLALKWRNIVLAEAVGGDEKSLKTRLAQAILSKMANFSPGIEAKWSYYRDGRLADRFDSPNPRKSRIYRVLRRSQFKAMAEITSFVDTFANSDSFAEAIFGMDFSNQEKKQLMEYIDKNWCPKLTYRMVSKIGVKNKNESHVFVYHVRTGEEMRRWLEQTDGENDRYRVVPPGKHRRAGECDNNVREVLTSDLVELPSGPKLDGASLTTAKSDAKPQKGQELMIEKGMLTRTNDQNKDTDKTDKDNKEKDTDNHIVDKEKESSETAQDEEDKLEKLLDGFVLFYDANKTSEIDKDDWFSALCESFKLSKFGALEVVCENVRPLRTRCEFKWKDRTLATAEGLTETQAKTAATLQLISKLEPFTYIIQAKEEYFHGGGVPPFIEEPDQNKNDFVRYVRRKDLPSYCRIFQTIDEFARSQSQGEIIFGPDFTWELKNEIVVYLKAKGLSHRYFTSNNQKPWTHMAIYKNVKPEELKEHLLKNGGENEKYKLIPPPKAEPLSFKTSEDAKVKSTKEAKKEPAPSAPKKLPAKVAEKKRKEEEEDQPLPLEFDSNKIQIKLKKFKVDKVDYPEDTGGDFPGLILWIGIRKNSVWQKNLFSILLDSFKLSKYGELHIEECEENVWGRREPFKKCVIKSSRKVLAVGLGESKTEAKNSASLQVLRQLRNHCYTIQAKESYFKEGKATPYNFNPDPGKAHVYKLIKRSMFKDRPAMIKYVNEFSKTNCSEEVIFGDDFSYDEREYILEHCRKIDLSYRLMKCQSVTKNMHTHIAIFHQQPPPVIKADLIKAGGENDMYRLVPPGGKITNQNNEADLWPDTLENGKEVSPSKAAQSTHLPAQTSCISQSNEPQEESQQHQNQTSNQAPENSNPIPSLINRVAVSGPELSLNFSKSGKDIDNFAPDIHLVDSSNHKNNKIPVKISGINAKSKLVPINVHKLNASPEKSNQDFPMQPLLNQQTGPQPITYQPMESLLLHGHPQHNHLIGPPPQFLPPQIQEVPFGPQPLFVPPPPIYSQPFMDTPLQFGPNPPTYIPQHPYNMGPVEMGPGVSSQPLPDNGQMEEKTTLSPAKQTTVSVPSVTITVQNSPKQNDLREELSKKRLAENRKSSPNRVVYDMTEERRVVNTGDDDSDGWSRKVFVAEPEGTATEEEQKGETIGPEDKSQDLREKLKYKDPSRETKGIGELMPRKNSPQKCFPSRMQRGPSQQTNTRFNEGRRGRSPHSDRQSRDGSREMWRGRELSSEERIVRHRESSHERRVFCDPTRTARDSFSGSQGSRCRSRSRSFSPRRRELSPCSSVVYRDLWDNIPARLSESIFMYKYIKQDSTVETDPYALLRATRSLSFNVDFDFIKEQTAIDEWYVSVELVTDNANIHPLVGEGTARTERDASLRAAHHAVDTVQKACRVIEPKLGYFCEGQVPNFIAKKSPLKTSVYEIIQNMDPGTPLAPYTVEMMFKMFISSDLEDIFFLANDFSYLERVLVIELATQMNLWWRLFGPRHPSARPDDLVSTQHVCVFKQKSALQLVRELLANGGSTEKYSLIDPREYRLTRPRFSRE